MQSPRGSLWHKWDLHVHTPASLTHNYGSTSDQAWERFFFEIEALPEHFKVLGINDYLFLDGYRKVREARLQGRMTNIDLLLPVVELRLASFGGSQTKLSRVNFHVIFSDEVKPEVIETQFIAALWHTYILSPEHAGLQHKWQGVATRESLADLGRMIIESVPGPEKSKFGSPLLEGFNNLNFPLEKVREALESHYFETQHLIAVGKTEWADVKWNDKTIADKKNIINGADLVFIAAETPQAYETARAALRVANVNDRLLDCSDAHAFSDSQSKDRIGNCHTWIKADTTFLGLLHTLKEFDERTFVGEEPPSDKRLKANGSRYIASADIRKEKASTLQEEWFNTSVPLNSGLIAIIGNKGSGKSALAEAVALAANTRHDDSFSFLNDRKFRQKADNKARHFGVAIEWHSGKQSRGNLGEPTNRNEPELVQFIPQQFLERICNELPGGEETDFDQELKRVIFSHVEPRARLGQNTLDDVIELKTRATEEAIAQSRHLLSELNRRIIALEDQTKREYRATLKGSLRSLQEQLADLRRARPPEVAVPVETPDTAAARAAIVKATAERDALADRLKAAENELARLNVTITRLESFAKRAETLEHNYDGLCDENRDLLTELGWECQEVVNLTVDWDRIRGHLTTLHSRRDQLEGLIDPQGENTPAREHHQQLELIMALQAKLDEPNRRYEQYRTELKGWKDERDRLLGSAEAPDTIRYYRSRLRDLLVVPARLTDERKNRNELVRSIHIELQALASDYKKLYAPIQHFIAGQEVSGKLGINFDVAIVDLGFKDRFFELIDRRVGSSFAGAVEGDIALQNIMASHDFNDAEKSLSFADQVIDSLRRDNRSGKPVPVELEGVLKKGGSVQGLYDLIYSFDYLRPRYTLRFGNKQLHELSPGEKGTLLLIFYLIADKSDAPLIIDQPEDNLDNETVYDVLVPCVRTARNRRQLILVTHNPNLAVVCDADQVIVASIDKDKGNRVTYESGALEKPAINRHVLDILEGTRPAFDNRGGKYL